MTDEVPADPTIPAAVSQLLERSHRLGADRRTTNYAGGNTSAKGSIDDPMADDPAALMWVKGSGGDLGTLRREGLSVIRVDRLRALTAAYRGPEHEDEMVELMQLCLHGTGGAPPSIDTAMHGLLDATHVDHLHPDSCLALATAADGPELTRQCFGDRVLWIPWRRPGFQLGLDIRQLSLDHPDAIGCILGGHGITTWGATSDECEQRSLWMVNAAADFLRRTGRPEPLGPVIADRRPLDPAARRDRAARIFPLLRRLTSTDLPTVGCWNDSDEVLDFLSRSAMPQVAARGTSCPDHFIRTKVRPLIVDAPSHTPVPTLISMIAELHGQYREDYRAYYRAHADASTPAMRGADPAVVLVPGLGMFTFGRDATTARLAGEFFVNAIHAMIGAESVSEYRPIDDAEKFRIEYWSLEEAKLRRLPSPKPLSGRLVLVQGTDARSGEIARALAGIGASVVLIGPPDEDAPAGVTPLDASDGEPVGQTVDRASLVYGGLDAIAVVGGGGGDPDELATAAAGVAGTGGIDLVLVEDGETSGAAPETASPVRYHRITLGSGRAPESAASGVVATLTSGAARSEMLFTESSAAVTR